MNNLTIGTQFTVQNKSDYRNGRTYKVTGFDADRYGVRFIVCEWKEEQGYKSSHIFYPSELN
jgi:hypothetical protein